MSCGGVKGREVEGMKEFSRGRRARPQRHCFQQEQTADPVASQVGQQWVSRHVQSRMQRGWRLTR